MAAERQICCVIMLCQMTAILSGVAILYLSVIVVIPSQKELEFNFVNDPIMCTTIDAVNLAAGGKKVDCEWSTCLEWCLSKVSSPCMQIFAMPRMKGAAVEMQECEILEERECSALDPELTDEVLCKQGECKDITGLYNCTKMKDNACRNIEEGFSCKGILNKTTIICGEKKCGKRLEGVFYCTKGQCNKLDKIESYKDCQRKCEDLDLSKGNTIVFNSDTFYHMNCKGVNSTGNGTLNSINNHSGWKGNQDTLIIFCTYVDYPYGDTNTSLYFDMNDCFNATLRNKNEVGKMKSYLKLREYKSNLPPSTQWLLNPEESLRLMNDTKLKINSQGCVNSLIKECKAFFDTHDTDGLDGRMPDRYPCFYSDLTTDFVVGKYDPETTYLMLMITSILPGTLFGFSCCCLYFCSKSVGVDEGGHLKVTLLNNKGKGGPPGGSMTLMELEL